MVQPWMIFMAAALGQTTQPAAEPTGKLLAEARPAAQTSVAALPTTRPASSDALARLQAAAMASASNEVTAADIGQLSGNPIDVEVTSDGTLILYGDEKDVAILEAFIDQMDRQPIFQPVFRIFELKSGDAADLATKIQQLWNTAKKPSKGQMRAEDRVTIVPETRSNTLMVAATEANIEAIAEIIDQLDKPSIGEMVKFEDIQLKNIKAAEAEATLKDMLKSLQERRGAKKELVTIKANPRLNMLLINAPEEDLKQIKHWIELIDVEPTEEAGGVVKLAIFPLQKAVAKDLVATLTEMLQTDTEASKAMQEQIRRLRVVKKGPDGSEQALSELDLEKPTKVFAEGGTNSVIVATAEKNLKPIEEMVRLLDSVPLAAELIVNVFPLEHADAETLSKTISDVFSQGKELAQDPGRKTKELEARIPAGVTGSALAYDIGVSADKRTNVMVVSGRAEQLLLVKQIVKSVDVPPSFGKFSPQLIKLEHASVNSIAEVVQKLADQRQKVLEQATSAATAERDRSLIIPDVRTNSLIVVAKEENFKEIAALAKQLDGVEDDWLGQIRIVNLVEDLAAAGIADKIEDLWERRAQLRKEGGLPEDKPVIVTDSRSNSLIIASNQDDFDAIKGLIEKLQAQKLAPMADIRMISLKHNDVGKVSEIVQKLFEERLKMSLAEGQKEQPSDRIAIVEDPITRTMLVASSKSNFDEVQTLVARLDVPLTTEGLFKTFFVKHADTQVAADFLTEVFKEGLYIGTGSQKDLPESVTKVTIVPDLRSGAIIISANPQNLAVAESLLKEIDRKDVPSIYKPRLVKLEHASVKSIADAVQKLADQQQKITAEMLSKGASERERTLIIPDVRTNSLIIVARDENFEQVANLARQLDGIEEDWLGQIQIINLRNLTATDISDKIEDLWERRSSLRREGGLPEDKPVIVTDARSNSLIIASRPDDFEAIMTLVNRLEAQRLAPMADIRTIVLQHNDASKVGDIVQNLFDERLKMSLAEGQKEQPSDRVAIIDDPMSRSLLVASTKEKFEEITALVRRLDVPPVADGLFRTFFVRNADISKASDLLEEMFDKGIYQGTGDKKALPEWATKVTIVPDLRSSALLVSASPENMEIVAQLIKEIDREDVPDLPAGAWFCTIKNADVVNVADMLEQMFEGMRASMTSDQKDQLEAKIIPDTRTKVLIVTGARYAIKRAQELVPQMDVESQQAAYAYKVYKLKESSASQLEPVITDLFDKRSTTEQTGKRTPIFVIPDDGSNSLIVTASEDDHKMVADLVQMLDRKSTIAEQMHVIPLAQARADQVADMLEELIEQQQGDRKGGFAVTPEPRTNSLLVWAAPDMLTNIKEIVTQLDNTRPKTEMALRVFQLTNAKAKEMSELLDEFFEKAGSGEGDDARQMIIKFTSRDPGTEAESVQSLVYQDITITPDENTNALMVLAPEKHIDMVAMMIRMLDSVEPQTADLRVFPLRNADATEMKDLLDELFQADSGSQDERRQLVFAGGEAGGAVGGAGAAVELAFSVDERTNSLIAAGSPNYLKIVETLVYKLDYQEIENRIMQVVHLRNRPADEVATAMRAYFESESQILEQAAEGEAAVRQSERQVTIEDGGEGSNTLLLSYNPRIQSQVVNMVNELDQAPEQVQIQVLIAEVTMDDRFEMGMEFALQDLLFSETAVEGPNGTVQGDNFDFIGGTDIGATGESALGGISFTVTGEDFNFLLRALQQEGRLEVLSRPSILVQDNQEANITIGERVPTVQDVVVSSNGVVTPSVTYEKVGVILTVTPIVNPDGYVSMEIMPEISSIGTSSVSIGSGVTLPTFTERSAETTVTVKDGETIIIGGLTTSRENSSESKVPLAGDVPILGNLFRANVRTSTRTELLMVLTPHVVRTPEDARTLAIEMRDQTGLSDNIRRSPLMGNLQVKPEDDQFGPDQILRPTGETKPWAEDKAPLGPDMDEMGPSLSGTKNSSDEAGAASPTN